ncbi:MAG TPA: hypothetical protein EYG92_09640 [Lutibacter sp.]|nr:hypothetical protein [Lutibacter sp.]
MKFFKKFGKKKDDEKKGEDQARLVNANDPQDDGDDSKNDDKNATTDVMQQAAMSGMMGGGGGDIKEMLKSIDTSGMSLKEKMGLKMLQKMPRKKQEEVMRQSLNPQELHKNKDMVLKQIDEMVKAGQIQKGQAEAVKAQMGLR